MPNHVCGIVVLVVFWDYRIGTWIPALSCCRGGFQTRPQGDASYGDTGIIVLARGFFAFSYLVGGYITRPYRGSFNVGVVMPNHVHGIVVLVVFWDYHIGTGIFCIFVFGGRV